MSNSTDNKKKLTQWFEIPVSDMERAKEFYEKAFNIEIHVMDMGELKMGVFPHSEVGCALCYHPEFYHPGKEGPLVYMNAEPDLQAYQDRVETAGGDVLVAKKQISPEHGYMSVFIDSEGNRMALYSTH